MSDIIVFVVGVLTGVTIMLAFCIAFRRPRERVEREEREEPRLKSIDDPPTRKLELED